MTRHQPRFRQHEDTELPRMATGCEALWASICVLSEDSAYYMRFFHASEFGIEAAEGVGELFVVDAEDVEHRGVEVAEVDRVFGDVVAEVVGAAEFDAGFDAGAG